MANLPPVLSNHPRSANISKVLDDVKNGAGTDHTAAQTFATKFGITASAEARQAMFDALESVIRQKRAR